MSKRIGGFINGPLYAAKEGKILYYFPFHNTILEDDLLKLASDFAITVQVDESEVRLCTETIGEIIDF